MELNDRQLKLIKSIVGNYINEADARNNEKDTHSGVDRLLLGGVIIECRKLIADIDADLDSRVEPFVPELNPVEG